jgi:quinol monooxygenase YgiN
MGGKRYFVSILLLLASGVAAPAAPPLPASRLVVCYIEAPAAQTGFAARSLKDYAAHSRQDAGSSKTALLHEVGRPNRMALIERWTTLDTRHADRRAASLQAQLADKIEAPVDCRLGNGLTPFITAARGGFHVLMHVDVVPAGSAQASNLLLTQRSAVLAAAGGLGFEAAVQADRPNHFAVHELWADRAAYEAYASSAPARDLRRQLAPIKGAPFDDRFFVAAD